MQSLRPYDPSCLPPSLTHSLSLSGALSLALSVFSYTHMHTHTHTQGTRERLEHSLNFLIIEMQGKD